MTYKNISNHTNTLPENLRDSSALSKINFTSLRAECKKCFGLCCVALYFSASEGFPADKAAGSPCINLQSDFTCSVHGSLRKKGLNGCTAYECFGSGQKVSQVTFKGLDWRKSPEAAKQMFDVFLIVRQLQEMLWYLTDALTLKPAHSIQDKLTLILGETEQLTNLDADILINLGLDKHRTRVNALLLNASEQVRSKFISEQKSPSRLGNNHSRRFDFFGADLRKKDLRGASLRGACLIAANLSGADLSGADLLGADLRDTDISGANLKDSIFLNQAQINTAKGDSRTKLPITLLRPLYWSK